MGSNAQAPWCPRPDPPSLHPAAPTAGTAAPLTSPNHPCFPLTQLLSLLTDQLPEASFCIAFCTTPCAHRVCCTQSGYALQTALGFCNKNKTLGVLSELFPRCLDISSLMNRNNSYSCMIQASSVCSLRAGINLVHHIFLSANKVRVLLTSFADVL